MEVGDLDVLDEGVVESEGELDGLFEVADPCVAVDNKGRDSVAVYTVDELLLFAVCAIKKLEDLFHGGLVVAFGVNLSVLVEVLGDLRPRNARAISFCNFLFTAQPDVCLGDLGDDQMLIIRDF